MTVSPTQLSLKYLRDEGYIVDIVERRAGPVLHDLFGMFDLIAIRDGVTMAVQTTSDNGGNVAKRITKIAESPLIGEVRACGWVLIVHGWRKKDNRWIVRKVDVT